MSLATRPPIVDTYGSGEMKSISPKDFTPFPISPVKNEYGGNLGPLLLYATLDLSAD